MHSSQSADSVVGNHDSIFAEIYRIFINGIKAHPEVAQMKPIAKASTSTQRPPV
jgi:hypothetical protein